MSEQPKTRLTDAEQAKLWGLHMSLESLERQAKANHRDTENLAYNLKIQAHELEDLLKRLESFGREIDPSSEELIGEQPQS